MINDRFLTRKALRFVALTFVFALIAGCAATSSLSLPNKLGSSGSIFPGGVSSYDFAVGQATGLRNVDIAQVGYTRYKGELSWIKLSRVNSYSPNDGSSVYFPLYARWRLNDRSEYLIDDLDLKPVMQAYFEKNKIPMPWQIEGRARHSVGDYNPVLAIDINDDQLTVKWIVITNRTAVNRRLSDQGEANKWDIVKTEHSVAVIKGRSVTGLDFNKTLQSR